MLLLYTVCPRIELERGKTFLIYVLQEKCILDKSFCMVQNGLFSFNLFNLSCSFREKSIIRRFSWKFFKVPKIKLALSVIVTSFVYYYDCQLGKSVIIFENVIERATNLPNSMLWQR